MCAVWRAGKEASVSVDFLRFLALADPLAASVGSARGSGGIR